MTAHKTLTNVTVNYDGNDITDNLNSASVNAAVNQIDTTVLSDNAATSIAGSVDWSVPVAGPWSKALDDILGPDAVSPPDGAARKNLVIVLGPSGAQVTYTWTAAAFVGNYNIEATDPAGLLTWTGDLSVSGAPVRT